MDNHIEDTLMKKLFEPKSKITLSDREFTNKIMTDVLSEYYLKEKAKEKYRFFLYISIFIIAAGIIAGLFLMQTKNTSLIELLNRGNLVVWLQAWVSSIYGKISIALILTHLLLIRGILVYYIVEKFRIKAIPRF